MSRRSPKSPSLPPNSPMLPQSPLLPDHYRSGCMWRLFSVFNFHHSRANRKLLSHRKHLSKQAAGTGDVRSGLILPRDSGEVCHRIDNGVDGKNLIVDAGEASVKKLMEEEMSYDQLTKKQITALDLKLLQSHSQLVGQLPKNHKSADKTRQRPCHIPVHGLTVADGVGHQQSSHPNLLDKSVNSLDFAPTTEIFCNQVHPKNEKCSSSVQKNISYVKHGQHNEINQQVVQMNEAAEACVNQMFIEGKYLSRDGADRHSKQFLDALEILNSNKELFLKLLQDPNSLLAKHIQDLRDSQVKNQQILSFSEAKLSEYQKSNARQRDVAVCTRKFEPCDRYPSKQSGDCLPLDTIVVLKSGQTSMQKYGDGMSHCSSLQSHHNLKNEGHSVRNTFFSFGHIKRRLKHAKGVSKIQQYWTPIDAMLPKTGDDCQGSGDGGKEIDRETVARNSVRKTHADIGEMINSSLDVARGDKISKEKRFELSIGHEAASTSESSHINSNLSTVRHPKRRESNIYVQPMNNLPEILSNRNEDFLRKHVPKPLGRTFSFPKYDFLPTFNSGREKDHGFGTAQMKYSPYSNYQIVGENKWWRQKENKNCRLSSLGQNVEPLPHADNEKANDQLQAFDSESNISGTLFSHSKVHESICSPGNDLSSKDSVMIIETNDTAYQEEINLLGVPPEPDCTHNTSANESTVTAKACREIGYLDYSRLNSPQENQPPISSSDVSSSNPLTMQKEEDSDGIKDRADQRSPISVLEQFYIEDVTSPANTMSQLAKLPAQPLQISFEGYCSAALERSPLNVEVNLSTSVDEHGPTSEYVRTVLEASCLTWDELQMKCHLSDRLLDPSLFEEEVCRDQSCGGSRLLFDCINEVIVEKNVVAEVMKRVDWHVLLELSPQRVEKLVEMDLARSATWMDIRIDTEDIVIEMVEGVLEELITETTFEL